MARTRMVRKLTLRAALMMKSTERRSSTRKNWLSSRLRVTDSLRMTMMKRESSMRMTSMMRTSRTILMKMITMMRMRKKNPLPKGQRSEHTLIYEGETIIFAS